MRLAAVVLVVCACGGKHEPAAPPPMPVDLATLVETQVVDSSEYLARLRSRTAATLQPQVDGQITEILAKPGDLVDEGQPLVRIDPGRQPEAVAQAAGTRRARQAQLELAQRNLERTKKLVASGALPEQELDNARTVVESAHGDVAALGAEIAGNRIELGHYRVLAPAHGVVGDIPVRVGDRVTTQTVITTVTDNTVLEANISIPVERVREVKLGTQVQLVDTAGQVVGEGKVDFIAPRVSQDTQSVLVEADIANAAGALRVDQILRARVVWSTRPGLVVPALAITRLGGQPFVFVATQVGPQLVAKQRPVKLGDLTNNSYVVASGLQAGERVVTSNVQKLRDGAPIVQAPAGPRQARPGSGAH